MPRYEFRCKKCDKTFEEKMTMTAVPIKLWCPHCKTSITKIDFEKILSKSTFRIKWNTNY